MCVVIVFDCQQVECVLVPGFDANKTRKARANLSKFSKISSNDELCTTLSVPTSEKALNNFLINK